MGTGETPRSREKGPAKVGAQILMIFIRTVGLRKQFVFLEALVIFGEPVNCWLKCNVC